MWLVLGLVVACMCMVVSALFVMFWFRGKDGDGGDDGDAYKHLIKYPPKMRIKALQPNIDLLFQFRSDNCWEFNKWVRNRLGLAFEMAEGETLAQAQTTGKPAKYRFLYERLSIHYLKALQDANTYLQKCDKGATFYDPVVRKKLAIAGAFDMYKTMDLKTFMDMNLAMAKLGGVDLNGSVVFS